MGGKGSGRNKTTPADLATPGGDRPTRPDWLDGEASWFWEEIAEELIRLGVAKRLDGPALVMAAFWFQRWSALARDPKSSTAELQKATKEFDGIARRFGLTPLDRKTAGLGSISTGAGAGGDNGDAGGEDPLVALLQAREG